MPSKPKLPESDGTTKDDDEYTVNLDVNLEAMKAAFDSLPEPPRFNMLAVDRGAEARLREQLAKETQDFPSIMGMPVIVSDAVEEGAIYMLKSRELLPKVRIDIMKPLEWEHANERITLSMRASMQQLTNDFMIPGRYFGDLSDTLERVSRAFDVPYVNSTVALTILAVIITALTLLISMAT